MQWSRTVRTLRELLGVEGWTRLDVRNSPLIINADGTVAVGVASGDEYTGHPLRTPQTKTPKGSPAVEALAGNKQLYLFKELEPVECERAYQTWYLLFHRTEDEIRLELSLPYSMGTDGRIDGFIERIILPSLPIDPEWMVVAPPDFGPDIQIDVPRRA
jgi:hypothetical protein